MPGNVKIRFDHQQLQPCKSQDVPCSEGMYSARAGAGTEELSKWIGIAGKLAMSWMMKPFHKALPVARQMHLYDPHDQAANGALILS